MKVKKVILLGDSITQGLGSKKINYTQVLSKMLGKNYVVENLALTGTTILYAEKILNKVIEKKPDYVVIVYGNVDAQIRPNRNGIIFKHIPKRFQKSGMLMPRPFYSHVFWKKVGQSIDNKLRSMFSYFIYQIDGKEQWVHIEDFQEAYQRILVNFKKYEIKVCACSTVYIDNNLFPGSLTQYSLFNNIIRKQAELQHVLYLDLFTPLKQAVTQKGWKCYYNNDHFHPNSGGIIL